jgi:hypothetical protein
LTGVPIPEIGLASAFPDRIFTGAGCSQLMNRWLRSVDGFNLEHAVHDIFHVEDNYFKRDYVSLLI